jgi:hypothetical protein
MKIRYKLETTRIRLGEVGIGINIGRYGIYELMVGFMVSRMTPDIFISVLDGRNGEDDEERERANDRRNL